MKCSRRIRPIVSTTSIPHRPLHAKAGSRTNRKLGGQFWTPIPQLRGSLFHAGSPQPVRAFARANATANADDHKGVVCEAIPAVHDGLFVFCSPRSSPGQAWRHAQNRRITRASSYRAPPRRTYSAGFLPPADVDRVSATRSKRPELYGESKVSTGWAIREIP